MAFKIPLKVMKYMRNLSSPLVRPEISVELIHQKFETPEIDYSGIDKMGVVQVGKHLPNPTFIIIEHDKKLN